MVSNNAEFLANEYENGREVRISSTGKNRTKSEMVSRHSVHKRPVNSEIPREPVTVRSGSQFSPTSMFINLIEYLFLIMGIAGGVLTGLFSARVQTTKRRWTYAEASQQLDRQRPPPTRPRQG